MPIRRGVEAIQERSKQIEDQVSSSRIPEVILKNDGEVAIMRFLTDEPIDYDAHDMFDPATGGRVEYKVCKRPDECDNCKKEIARTRIFMFWVWLDRILHPQPHPEGNWQRVEVGRRTYYEEPVGSVHLLRRKFGRGGALWNQFEEVFENYGTWRDRPYSFRRKGAPRSMETTYTLTPLEKSPMPSDLVELSGKLPSLEAVAQETVVSLEGIGIDGGESQQNEDTVHGSEDSAKRAPGGRRSRSDLSEEIPGIASDEVEPPKITTVIPSDPDIEDL